MVCSLVLAGFALRAGLSLRRARLTGQRREPGMRRRHLRLAKPACILLGIGFLGGPTSMVFLRGREPFETAHALASSCALLLFGAVAILGLRLERGRSRALDVHAFLGLLALLAGGVAFVTGFVLLP